ncbi:hypothetical protein J7J41_00125 [bacterium]|nr:hypothetical protein [bacterium]
MITLPLYNQILIAFINLIGICLAFLVLQYSPLKWIKRIFLLMIVLMFFWINFAYLARLVGRENDFLSLISLKIAWFVTPLLFMCLYFLVRCLFGEKEKHSKLDKFVLVCGTLLSVVTLFTSLVVKNIEFIGSQLTIIYGKGMLPFLGIVFFIMCATLFFLFKEYFRNTGRTRTRIKYILIGTFIFYLANVIFNIFFPLVLKTVKFYWLGDYSAIFLLGFTAYAIVRRQLFEIKVVLTEFLVGVIAILLIVNIIGSRSIFEYVWKSVLLAIFFVFGYLLIKSVTREIKLRKSLQVAYQKLEELDKAKTEFISIASHQLKGPLGIIKGYLWMILNEKYGFLSKKIKEPLENIFKLNERLIKVVNDLLNLSRLELGRIKLEKEYFQIEDIVYNIYKELFSQAKEKGLKFIIKKPQKKLPKIFGNKLKIREAIFNVIDNAIKYTQKGFIKIEFFQRENLVFVKVSDSGIGFSREETRNIFQSFRRTRRGAILYAQGAGLGLYIAKKFIEIHKGQLWAKSKGENKGATFFIALPVGINSIEKNKF